MVTALVAGSAAVLGVLLAAVATRLSRARSGRRLDPVHARIDEHVDAIGDILDRVGERVAAAATSHRDELELSLDLESLLEQIVVRAAALTGAQAVAIRVQGPGGEPVVSSFGTSDGAGLLETALGPPDERPFRALTINWTYGPAAEEAEDAYSSALVVPVVESGISTGALVAYAGPAGAFQSEHLRSLRDLADEAAPQIAAARRFAELGRRSLTDPVTGVRNRSGYELELEREVARAHRSGRPLSLLLLALEDAPATEEALEPEPAGDERALQELAALLTRTARATDIPCRRRQRELAVVLPETKDEGARRLWARLHRETGAATFAPSGRTFAVGFVEWRPNETSDALDARAAAAVGRTDLGAQGAVATAIGAGPRRGRNAPVEPVSQPRRDLGGRLREHLEGEIGEARRLRNGLAVVTLEVDEVERGLAAAAIDELRAHVAARIDDCLEAGSVVSRLGPDRFAIVLPRSTAADAQSMLAVLQASLEVRPRGLADGPVTFSAGVAELSADDDAVTVLGRAEQALAQARAAGRGGVVVA